MSLSGDIAAARQSGRMSDDELLTAYKAYDPTKAADIQAGLQQGLSATDVLNALGSYDDQYGNHIENQGLGTKATGALQQGVADELTGLGNTAKETIGQGALSDTLSGLGKSLTPNGYQSASQGLGDTSRTLGDRAGYIPRAMVEGAPGMATDVAAGAAGARIGGALGMLGGPLAELTVPAGTALGGALGFGGSYLLRTYGSDAERAAQARTDDPDAAPNDEDKARALASGIVAAGLSRVGIKGALGEAGADTIGSTVAGLGKSAGVDAATGMAADAVDDAVVSRRDPTADPSGLALAAMQGAVAGGALRSVTAFGDANNAIKFRDIDPVNGEALASLYSGRDFSTPAKAYTAMKQVDGHLDTHADYWADKAQPQIDALEAASGYTDDTALALKSVRQSLSDGNVIDPITLETLRQRLGDYREGANLMDVLTLQSTQNQMKAVGNFRDGPNGTGTFGGGISDTELAKAVLNPLGKVGKVGPYGLGIDLGLAHFAPHLAITPALVSAAGAAQLAAHLGAKGADAVLRNTNPLEEFARRFGLEHGDGEDDPLPTSAALPSFQQQDAVANQAGTDVASLATQAVLRQRVLAAAMAPTNASGTPALRRVRVGNQEVAFDPTTVGNPERYAASVARRMQDREDVVQGAKGVLPEAYWPAIDALHTDLTQNSANNRTAAQSMVTKAIGKLPPEYQGNALSILDTPKLWSTFSQY